MAECTHTKLKMKLEKVQGSQKPLQVVRCYSCGQVVSVLQDVDLEYYLGLITEKLGAKKV